jgi:diguanylate cyclase (GGDEF)-like protein/PAS domain S-box-containing protein
MQLKWGTRQRQWLLIALVMAGSVVLFAHAMARLQHTYIDGRKQTVQRVVEVAHQILAANYQLEVAGKLTRRDAQQASLVAIRALRYGDNDYFWINDMYPRMVMHPIQPELEGGDLSDYGDPTGFRLFVAFVDEVRRSGAGFVEYLWPKPGQYAPVPKISYVKAFQPWGWIIGSGLYRDDIDRQFRSELLENALLLLVVAVSLGFVARTSLQYMRTEKHLRESEARLRDVVEKLPVAALIASGERVMRVNQRFTQLLGYDATDAPDIDVWWPKVFPDPVYRESVTKAWWQQVADTMANTKNQPVSREYRVVAKDGRVCEVEASYCQSGEWAIVSLYDITERKAAEAYQRLTARVYETTGEAILVTDAEARIVAVNPAFCQITGYTSAEVLGKNPNILNSGRHDRSFHQTMWQTLLETGQWQGEIWNKRKSGEVFPEWQTVSTVRDAEGRITNFVAVFSDVSEIRRAQEMADRLSWRDTVTGLANRALFIARLEQKLASAHRDGGHAAVLLIDLDRFKMINEARGLALGDALLRAVADCFSNTLSADVVLARLSSDEFAVLLPQLMSSSEQAGRDALAVAEQLRLGLQQRISVEGEVFHLEASIGITVFPQSRVESASDVMRQADMAMQRAKTEGGGRSVFFETEMGDSVTERYRLESELRKAVAEGELRLYLQPQVDAGGKQVGAEALVRWEHPERGLIPPGVFISLAELSDLIVGIDRWMLTQVCRLLARLERSGTPIRISVNISPRHFQKDDFVDDVKRQLAASGADPSRLVLEITEGLVIGDISAVVAKMTTLTALGIHFSMDDFGTGYSSLAYLKRLPIHELKIDKSFINDATTDPNDAALVETILSVAKHLHLKVVAEGVETAEQAAFLNQRGDVIHQGYFFGRPIPADAWIAALIDRSSENAPSG